MIGRIPRSAKVGRILQHRVDRQRLGSVEIRNLKSDGASTANEPAIDFLATLLPILKDSRLIEARVGLRPATPDELPVIGPDPLVPGLIHATGHYRNGVLLAPITASVIADLIVEGKRDACLDAFATLRLWQRASRTAAPTHFAVGEVAPTTAVALPAPALFALARMGRGRGGIEAAFTGSDTASAAALLQVVVRADLA